MGCNTSKEAALPLAEEKDKVEASNDKEEAIPENSKPESAKTVTLTSNGFVLPKEDEKEETDKNDSTQDPELEGAAVKIQAAFRGHQARKTMKQPAKQEDKSPSSQNLAEEFSSDDKELCDAATKIQASFRGHMIRKQMEKKEDESPTPTNKNEEEELDIDLTDPDLNKAAIKIQASFRGHMVRKEEEETK